MTSTPGNLSVPEFDDLIQKAFSNLDPFNKVIWIKKNPNLTYDMKAEIQHLQFKALNTKDDRCLFAMRSHSDESVFFTLTKEDATELFKQLFCEIYDIQS